VTSGPADGPAADATGSGPAIPIDLPEAGPTTTPELSIGGARPPATPPKPPGAVEIVARGLDVNVQLSGVIRRLSIFIGLLVLAAIGPIAIVAIAHSAAVGGFDWIVDLFDENRLTRVPVTFGGAIFVLGAISAGVLSVDVQLMAIGTVGAWLTGRTLALRSAVRLARAGFWRLVFASIAVGLIVFLPERVVVDPALRGAGDLRLLLTTLFDLLISTPFAYVGAAVVLAGVGPLGAVRASWRMARRRWRLAFVIGIVNTAVSYLATFAIGAALDILVRIGDALGIDRGLGTAQIVELTVIVGLAIVALGSLTMTIAALSVGPQVVAWLGLGGPVDGLGRGEVHPLDQPARSTRLVSWPMTIALGVEFVLALASTLDEVSGGGRGL
jgi:hypothetical protein